MLTLVLRHLQRARWAGMARLRRRPVLLNPSNLPRSYALTPDWLLLLIFIMTAPAPPHCAPAPFASVATVIYLVVRNQPALSLAWPRSCNLLREEQFLTMTAPMTVAKPQGF